MSHSQITRRGFCIGCSAAIASLAGSRFNSLAFAAPGSWANDELLVVCFLRGGQDGLNLVVPTGGTSDDRAHYDVARPQLGIAAAVAAQRPLGSLTGPSGSTSFGFHPAMAPLYDLFQANKLSVIAACGMAANERSHFDSMNWMELGTPGISSTGDGWLTRHLATATNLPAQVLLPSLSVGSLQPISLLASYETVNMTSPDTFSLSTGPWAWRSAQRVALRHLYEGNTTWLHQAGLQALDAVDIVELYASGGYTPRPGSNYPDTWFGDNLQTIAQLTKLDLGLRIATLDLGGWDTHENQGTTAGVFSTLAAELAQGLRALWHDLDEAPSRVGRLTLVVQSEFGRRVGQNLDDGTDHGHGNNMLVMSGNAIGGLHGSWPGLDPGQLNDGDVEVTTDFRRVLSEILIRRLGNPRTDLVFPGYTGYAPLGIVAGQDLPVGAEVIFADGFDTGSTARWDGQTG
jgi:uncharacterized protein (DUF1501 family)